ncbi:hypothetical protein Tco_0767095 [Tanacetum coccineum]
MAESSSHNPSLPKITPKEEPVTLDRLESLNPFLPVYQIELSFEEIAFKTNNEVALLYPSHPNLEYFRKVLDFISKCCLKEAFIRAPIQYKEYLSEFWYTAKTLDDSKIWVSTPTGGIREDIGYNGEIGVKGILKKSCLPPRFISLLLEYMIPEYDNEELAINLTQVFSFHNWELKPNQTEGPPFTYHMKAICNLDVPMDSKYPKPSSQTEEVPQGKNPRAKSGLRRKKSSKHTSKSKTEASKSKTSQLEKETQSSSAKDKSPSHPSPPTPVVGEMHKEAQQAAGGLTSLGATRHDALIDSTTEADPRNSAPNDSIPLQQDQTKSARDGLKTAHTDSGINKESRANEISNKIKLGDLSDFLKDTRSAFFTTDSLQDKPIIVLDESEEEEEVDKDKDTHATSHDKDELEQQKAKVEAKFASLKARPSYIDINQLADLLVTSLKPEFSKILASHDFASCLPIELKEIPLKFTELSREIKELKKHVKDMEIELLGDLKKILTKLETFTSTISSLTSQVAELKNIKWELPAEFLDLPSQECSNEPQNSMTVPNTQKGTLIYTRKLLFGTNAGQLNVLVLNVNVSDYIWSSRHFFNNLNQTSTAKGEIWVNVGLLMHRDQVLEAKEGDMLQCRGEEHLDSDAETEIDDNTIPYHQYLLDTEAQNVLTEVSADTSDKVSMIAILTDLQTQLDGHAKVNQEKCLEIETLKNELRQCKQEICRLDTHKVKLDLENKVRQEQALVIQRNKRNAIPDGISHQRSELSGTLCVVKPSALRCYPRMSDVEKLQYENRDTPPKYIT